MNLIATVRPLAWALLLTTCAAQAQAPVTATADAESNYRPSAAAMTFDLLIVRPVSLVATVLGSGLFILQLPLSLLQAEPPSDAARSLVIEPAAYTFSRPLGQMD